jgi:hypothetical protein
MPRWPWSRSKAEHVDPNGPHAFRSIHDPGLGAAAAHGGRATPSGALLGIAITSNLQRDQSHCGVPGCGRERTDSIHDANRRS